MMISLTLDPQTGDFFKLDDIAYELPITLQTLSLGKFIKKGKVRGAVVYNYEFPDDFKFPKKRGRKSKVTVLESVPDDEGSENENQLEEEAPKTKKGKSKKPKNKKVDKVKGKEEPELGQKTQLMHKTSVVIKGRKTKFVDDKTVVEKDNFTWARAKKRPDAKKTLEMVKMQCSVCPSHFDMLYPGEAAMAQQSGDFYRCHKCMGG